MKINKTPRFLINKVEDQCREMGYEIGKHLVIKLRDNWKEKVYEIVYQQTANTYRVKDVLTGWRTNFYPSIHKHLILEPK